MADPNTTNKFLIYLGNGAQPTEVFGWPCGATNRQLTLTNNTGETVVMDCSDPLGTASAVQRWTESQDTAMTISGQIATEYLDTWRDWADSGDARNVRAVFDVSGANNGGYWQLPAILGSFEVTGEGKGVAQFTATITGAGRRVWTDAA